MPDFEQEKMLAARRSLDFVRDGMAVGLGSGSTARYFVKLLGDLVREGLRVRAIPTSLKTQSLARKVGIPLEDFSNLRRLDLTVDGADEIDLGLNLIKGGGGALLREKIVASVTERLVIIGDSRKLVPALGAFPLAVEAIRFGWQVVADQIRDLGADVELRHTSSGRPFRTSENNFILDCRFGRILEPLALSDALTRLTGVVEHGLFIGLAHTVVVGRGDQTEVLDKSENSRSRRIAGEGV
jgi:ribose 5-phosphate isomerase A